MNRSAVRIDRSKDNAVYYGIPVIGSFYRLRLRMVAELLGDRRVPMLLDIGYGSGRLARELGSRAGRIACVDLHDYHTYVRDTLLRAGFPIQPVRGDAAALPFRTGTFDAATCVSLLEHVSDLPLVVAEISRVLRPGGALVAGFPPKSRLTAACFRLIGFDHVRLHPNSERAILAALETLFTIDCVKVWPRRAPLYVVARCTRRE